MRLRSLILLVLVWCTTIVAAPVTLTFEGLGDVESVTNQYSGLAFTNTIAFVAGFSLNEAEFPPYSGITVVSDDGGPVEIVFGGSPINLFTGRVTYLANLVIQAYSGSALVDSAVSHYTSNLALSGDAGSLPNELVSLSDSVGFNRVVITGLPQGGSFGLDDVTYETGVITPEPSSFALLGFALFGLWLSPFSRISRIR